MSGVELDNILSEISKLESGGAVVLVTGVFDVLHQEHLVFLEKARQAGDYLVIGVETDDRVRQMKGSGRPINSEIDRLSVIKKLDIADGVFILPKKFNQPEDHMKLINTLKPSVLAISSHTSHQEEKARIMESIGGKLRVVHTHNPKVSSTKILKN